MAALKGLVALAAVVASPALASAQVVEHYHLDAVGNARVVTNAGGQVVRHDYLQSGEECNRPLRLQPGLNAGQPRKFTGNERDQETGLDYFGARYYASRVGRFTSVDPVYTWREHLVDPQRWNRYAYARNNPLRYVDPDGRATLPANTLQARALAPPPPLPPGASGWQQALHTLAVISWALNPGGIMPIPAVMAVPEAVAATAALRAAEIHAAVGGGRHSKQHDCSRHTCDDR